MKNLTYLLTLIVSLFAHSANAQLIGIDTVDGMNSLYYENWGHSYNSAWTGGNAEEDNANGVGSPARAFQATSGFAYGFTSGDAIHITATGCVNDENATTCTGPEDSGGHFRNLSVYSLIGVWSSDASSINPINLISGLNPAFVIGDLLDLVVPTFTSPLYLFMATNDGNFSDNSGAYTVRIETLSNVPAPSILSLILFGLLFRKKIGLC